jgi:hypothetical protein
MLAAIGNRRVFYARQANVTRGRHQVNSSIGPCGPSRAREFGSAPNRLSEVGSEQLPGAGASPTAGHVDPQVEVAREIERAKNAGW